MVFERSEHEPEERDPEEDFRDPDSDSFTIPRIDPPEVDRPEARLEDVDVPPDVARTFWIVVVVVNVAVLAVSLGVMLVAFRGETTTGAGLFVGGVVLFGLAYRRYRAFRRGHAGSESDGTEGPTPDGTDDSEPMAEPAADTDSEPTAEPAADTDSEPTAEPAADTDSEPTAGPATDTDV